MKRKERLEYVGGREAKKSKAREYLRVDMIYSPIESWTDLNSEGSKVNSTTLREII